MNRDERLVDGKVYVLLGTVMSLLVEAGRYRLKRVFYSLGRLLGEDLEQRYTSVKNTMGMLLTMLCVGVFSVEMNARCVEQFWWGLNDERGSGRGSERASDSSTEQDANDDGITSWEDLAEEIGSMIKDFDADGEIDAIRELLDNEEALVATCEQIAASVQHESEMHGFCYDFDSLSYDTLYKFVQSKVYSGSAYINDVRRFQPFFEPLQNYEPFVKWFNGVVVPFSCYWDQYGSHECPGVNFHRFGQLGHYDEQLKVFLLPIASNASNKSLNSTLINAWINSVILPFVAYNDQNFDPLLSWFAENMRVDKNLALDPHSIWDQLIKGVMTYNDAQLHGFDFSRFRSMIQEYLRQCYLGAFLAEATAGVPNSDTFRRYDKIEETVSYILLEASLPQGDSLPLLSQKDIETMVSSNSVEDLLTEQHETWAPLIEPSINSLTFLQDAVKTSRVLRAHYGVSIVKFINLRLTKEASVGEMEKELEKILGGLNPRNWLLILSAVDTFISTFIKSERSEHQALDRLILEQLLRTKLPSVASDYYHRRKDDISANTYFEIIKVQFWDFISKASNFNEKIGNLHDACNCIDLVDDPSLDLLETNKQDLVKIKHFLKALSKLKNFRLILEKGKPSTPSDILNKFCITSDKSDSITIDYNSPIGLVGLILEQNPKSYLAFEKLYKIFNDLMIFASGSYDDPREYFNKLKSMCIESALIDDNFKFAHQTSMELLDNYSASTKPDLKHTWLAFYQVGKYVSPKWIDESIWLSGERLDVLLKQRYILSMTLKYLLPSDSSMDNSKLVLSQFIMVNDQIDHLYQDIPQDSLSYQANPHKNTRSEHIAQVANEIINDATNSTSQASEKLSNLFVSGLGWAIGANPS